MKASSGKGVSGWRPENSDLWRSKYDEMGKAIRIPGIEEQ